MKLGVVGLGRMGGGIARRLTRKQIEVVGYDQDASCRTALADAGVEVVADLAALAERLPRPRAAWVMLPSGSPVDETIEQLATIMDDDDLIVDGGNCHYPDSVRRHAELRERGIRFLDVGTSGGIAGEEGGYCLMIGGEAASVERLRPVFEALASGAGQGWAHVGAPGAGHFSKMIHNGVEYGMMQAFAEGFALLDAKQDLGLDSARIAEVWRHGSVVRSWLLDLIAERLKDPTSLAKIAPYVEDSGEGRWAIQEALDLDIPAPVITSSLLQRIRSRVESGYSERLLAALRQSFGGHAVKSSD